VKCNAIIYGDKNKNVFKTEILAERA